MLPDFKVPVELVAGDRRTLVVRDVPACVFWYGFPDIGRKYPGFDFPIRMALWEQGVLHRAGVRPRFTPGDIARLGAGVRLPVRAYLDAVGFRVRAGDPPPPLDLDELGEPSGPRADDAALRAWVPTGVLRQLFAATASAIHVPPAALWHMPISDMLFNCRVAMVDEMLARIEAAITPPAEVPATGRPPAQVIPIRPVARDFVAADVRDPMTVIGVERG